MASEEEKNRIQRILDRVPGNIVVDVLDHLRNQQFRAQPEPVVQQQREEEAAVPPEPAEPTAPEPPKPVIILGKKKVNGEGYTSPNRKESRYPGAEEWNDLKDIFG